ncbi:hypothetical protein TNCV_1339781 [Trichonephila clavipes]|uniref:Uncharacterized protein n=1 Tax=Trichonephila clavipes TaxID=2585209 RepID=A0A8X6V134_TRICX|nr:hypothetical protein TNCV_1339781 [Trichonephila clavipes]
MFKPTIPSNCKSSREFGERGESWGSRALPQILGGIEPNRTVTCMMLKVTDNDRRKWDNKSEFELVMADLYSNPRTPTNASWLLNQNGKAFTAAIQSYFRKKNVKDLLFLSFSEDHGSTPSGLATQVLRTQSVGLLVVGLPENAILPRSSDNIRDAKKQLAGHGVENHIHFQSSPLGQCCTSASVRITSFRILSRKDSCDATFTSTDDTKRRPCKCFSIGGNRQLHTELNLVNTRMWKHVRASVWRRSFRTHSGTNATFSVFGEAEGPPKRSLHSMDSRPSLKRRCHSLTLDLAMVYSPYTLLNISNVSIGVLPKRWQILMFNTVQEKPSFLDRRTKITGFVR